MRFLKKRPTGQNRDLGGDIRGNDVSYHSTAQPADDLVLNYAQALDGSAGDAQAFWFHAVARVEAALAGEGVRVPPGFYLGSAALQQFLHHNHLHPRLLSLIEGDALALVRAAESIPRRVARLMAGARFPQPLARVLQQHLQALQAMPGGERSVTVSAVIVPLADDRAGPAYGDAIRLHITTAEELFLACRDLYAQLIAEAIVTRRVRSEADLRGLPLVVQVQRTVPASRSVSGTLQTRDPETGFDGVISIAATHGLVEALHRGDVTPDEYVVSKKNLRRGHVPILRRRLGRKHVARVASGRPYPHTTQRQPVEEARRQRFCLRDEEVLVLARQASLVEAFCAEATGRNVPLRIDWARDEESGELYLLQVRPETLGPVPERGSYREFRLLERAWARAEGSCAAGGVVTGRARVLRSPEEAGEVAPGDILVVPQAGPEWLPLMSRVAGLVTDEGSCCSPATVQARALHLPAVVGCGDATRRLRNGELVTLACTDSERGRVLAGEVSHSCVEWDLRLLRKTCTDLVLDLSEPERAFEYARLPVQGVGLVRMEYLIQKHIGVHPRALLEYERQASDVQMVIDELTRGFDDRREFYVQRLAEGIGTIAAAFYPREVHVRLSDFQSNEYAALYGGEQYENHEENPLLGLRGAMRYRCSVGNGGKGSGARKSPDVTEDFRMECEAIRRVREDMGLTNLHLLVPFVRSVEEGAQVLEALAQEGLAQGRAGLRIRLMCETPANVLLADEFLALFDGFSIGLNDLTQLTLGMDRHLRQFDLLDPRNRAVRRQVEQAIAACHAQGKFVGVCGAVPTNRTEMTRWLVEQRVDSITLEPASYFELYRVVAQTESELFESDTQEIAARVRIPA